LGKVDTYYTRPMSPPWSRPLEVDRLADGAADVDFVVPLAELPGLRPDASDLGGEVSGRASFRREEGIAVAELSMTGSAQLRCQRCLQPLEYALEGYVRIGLANTEADTEAGRMPADLEPMLAPGGRISIGELITEELLLSLPIVPLHGQGAQCVAAQEPGPESRASGSETHRPFARLGEMLKR
jgi:uncharacterized protein